MIKERIFRLDNIKVDSQNVLDEFSNIFRQGTRGRHLSSATLLEGGELDTFHLPSGITMEIKYFDNSQVIGLYGENPENFNISLLNKLMGYEVTEY